MNAAQDTGEARRGMELVARLPDIMPDRASERIEPIYREVQETLRVPIVRSLANYPDYLQPAWQRLRPSLRTQRFERAADRLRAEALLEPVPPGPSVSTEAANEMDRIRAFNDTIHYVLPKLLLIATALDGADFAVGERGETAADGAAQIPSGVAAATVKVQLVDPEQAGERVRQIFASVKERHGHSLVSSYYRGLANWPAFLDGAWEAAESPGALRGVRRPTRLPGAVRRSYGARAAHCQRRRRRADR